MNHTRQILRLLVILIIAGAAIYFTVLYQGSLKRENTQTQRYYDCLDHAVDTRVC